MVKYIIFIAARNLYKMINSTMQKVLSRLIALLFILLWSHTGMAQQQDSILLLDYTLDDLMNLRVESAAKRSETIADVPASIVVISRQDIENYGWQTLEEVLSNVPGMYHINDYLWFGADNFGIRGFFSSGSFSTMVVMVNGVSQREDWYNSFPLSKLMLLLRLSIGLRLSVAPCRWCTGAMHS